MADIDDEQHQGFIDRLNQLKGSMTIADFARSCGMIPTTMQKYFTGSLPAIDKVDLIARTYDVTTDWLIRGNEAPLPVDFADVPVFAIKASAGDGQELALDSENSGQMLLSRNFLHQFVASSDDLGIVHGQGDSMRKPDGTGIHDGDMLIVNFSVREHRHDDIYLLDINGFVMVKRLKRLVAGGFEVISDNPDYGRETLSPDKSHDIRVLGHVFWHGHPTR